MKRTLVLLFCLMCLVLTGQAQSTRQAVVHDTRPVIQSGPYLMAPSDTAVTIMWTTDTPAYSKVLYGTGDNLTQVAEPQVNGLKPVGTLHKVRLTGLQPGRQYRYRVVSTQVVDIKPNFPEKGQSAESPVHSFTTLDRKSPSITFSFITDTQHENLERLGKNLDLVDWQKIDFLVHGGDPLSHVKSGDQIINNFLDPIGKRLAASKALVHVRGNHETRGPFARSFGDYIPTGTGEFYYTFDAGPVHFIVLDSGEDKTDAHAEYSGLNDFATYKDREFQWLKQQVAARKRVKRAPFTVLLMHNPHFGFVKDESAWIKLANELGVDLMIAGHEHRFEKIEAGEKGARYPILVVNQDQIATVTATATTMEVVTVGQNGQVDSFSVRR